MSNIRGNGILEMGVVDHRKNKTELKMDFGGKLEVVRDLEKIQQGAQALLQLGSDLSIPGVSTIARVFLGFSEPQ